MNGRILWNGTSFHDVSHDNELTSMLDNLARSAIVVEDNALTPPVTVRSLAKSLQTIGGN